MYLKYKRSILNLDLYRNIELKIENYFYLYLEQNSGATSFDLSSSQAANKEKGVASIFFFISLKS